LGFGELTKENREKPQENPRKEDLPCKGNLTQFAVERINPLKLHR
jgi:hypothetical protein